MTKKQKQKSKPKAKVQPKTPDTLVYWVGGAIEGMIIITHKGPQGAADLYRTESGDTKKVEVYLLDRIGEFKGKKVKAKPVACGDISLYYMEDVVNHKRPTKRIKS